MTGAPGTTPGPWQASDVRYRRDAMDWRNINTVADRGEFIASVLDRENAANARLIAAAPELYAAGECAVDILESYITFLHHMPADEIELHPYIPSVEEAFDRLFAALARARGERP